MQPAARTTALQHLFILSGKLKVGMTKEGFRGTVTEVTPTDRVLVNLRCMWPHVLSVTILLFLASTYAVNLASAALQIPAPDLYDVLLSGITVIVLHETLHAAAARLAGVRVKLGLGRVGPLPVAYVSHEDALPLSAYRWVALAPLAVLTPLSLTAAVALARLMPELSSFFLVTAVLNTCGSGGDLLLYSIVARAPSDALVVDMGAAVEVRGWSQRPGVPLVAEWCTLFLVCFIAVAAASVAASLAVRGAVTVGPLVMAQALVSVGRGFTVEVSVGPGTLLLSCLAATLLLALRKPTLISHCSACGTVMSGNDSDE